MKQVDFAAPIQGGFVKPELFDKIHNAIVDYGPQAVFLPLRGDLGKMAVELFEPTTKDVKQRYRYVADEPLVSGFYKTVVPGDHVTDDRAAQWHVDEFENTFRAVEAAVSNDLPTEFLVGTAKDDDLPAYYSNEASQRSVLDDLNLFGKQHEAYPDLEIVQAAPYQVNFMRGIEAHRGPVNITPRTVPRLLLVAAYIRG